MLSLRYRERIKQRFDVMKNIEQELEFRAHSALSDSEMKTPRDETCRKVFYLCAVILGTLTFVFQICKQFCTVLNP